MERIFLIVIILVITVSCQNIIDPAPGTCLNSDLSLQLVSLVNATDCSSLDGEIEVQATGGDGIYQFRIGTGSFMNKSQFMNLNSGPHMVSVMDGIGCVTELEVFLPSDNGVFITGILTSATDCGSSTGSLTISAEGGTGILYNIDGGIFQSSNTFSGLSQQTYTIGVMDDAGCEIYSQVHIKSGISFDIIKSIIDNNCAVSGCHVPGGIGRTDYSIDANIVSNAESIKTRTENGSMPRKGSGYTLTQQQIDEIACWVDDGALLN